MSVLIKGMEMPQNCDKCRFQSAFKLYCDAMPYNFCGNTDDIERPDWCPLIEVPTPHGRLIDGDAVNRKMDERIETLKDDASMYEASCVATALEMFAPTVIEAEE